MDKEFPAIINYEAIEVGRRDQTVYNAILAAARVPGEETYRQSLSRKVLFVSFYTPDYKKPAKRLVQSLDRFGLPNDVVRVKTRGGYYENVRHKPRFLLEMLEKHPEWDWLVWLDADGEMTQFPKCFYYDIPTLLSFHWHNFHWPITSTIMVANKPATRTILEAWMREDENTANRCPEQKALGNLLKKTGLYWTQLPHAYAALWRYGCEREWAVFRHERWGRNPKPRKGK